MYSCVPEMGGFSFSTSTTEPNDFDVVSIPLDSGKLLVSNFDFNSAS